MRGEELQEKLASIEMLILDFDGVLTSNTVYVNEDGREMVRCSRADGIGIKAVQNVGVNVCVITAEKIYRVAEKRCQKLGIVGYYGVENKLLTMGMISGPVGMGHVCYVGNDTPDIECMDLSGLAVCPADAHPEVYPHADIVLSLPGGAGCVRELCDMIVEAKGG